MNTIFYHKNFAKWLGKLKDRRAYGAIVQRIDNARYGNFGTVRALRDGVCEMKIDIGPGYRVYYARQEKTVYLLLIGGDKSTQQQDIEKAVALWKECNDEE
ncbi:MAG: type II toxin-antitoxin system RelE/ParE family toxin [Deltaproteobacteria bacterium]|nr:type II toxin-antitoxin system RelE/ParE family toxin [Deltaproteobacteria bacterium]